MRVTDEQLDRLWRIRETLTDFADIAALELAISALSHAAGQEGEQCRAASGFDLVAAMESWHSALDSAKELAINAPDDRYWKRANDVVAYLMTRAPNADSALSRGVPEGMVLVPRSSAEMAAVVCDEWGELFFGTPGFDKYERFTYGPAVEMLRDELRAIAAQRKEGE